MQVKYWQWLYPTGSWKMWETAQEKGWRKCHFQIFSQKEIWRQLKLTAKMKLFQCFLMKWLICSNFPSPWGCRNFSRPFKKILNVSSLPAGKFLGSFVAQRRTSTNTNPRKDYFDPQSIEIHSWVLLRGAPISGELQDSAALGFSDQRSSSDRYLRSFLGNSLAGPKIETLLLATTSMRLIPENHSEFLIHSGCP